MSEGVNNDSPAPAGEVEAAAPVETPVVPAVDPVAAEPAPVPPAAPSAPSVQVEETPVVHKHFVAPALIPLERVDGDLAFCVRDPNELEDVARLATDIARLGQLFPVDVRLQPPDRFQVVTGFRRVAALRFLQREKVLARLHTDLTDADATLMALASAIHSKTVSLEALGATRAALEEAGRLSPAARDMLDKALTSDDGLAPETLEEEVDADELAADVTVRLGQCNQDLSLLADVFGDLDDARKEELLKQLRYSVELVAFLESKQ